MTNKPTTDVADEKRRWGFSGLRGRSISRNLALGLSLIIFLVQAALMTAIAVRFSRSVSQEVAAKADDYIDRLTGVLTLPVWHIDRVGIRSIGNEFGHNELVVRIRVADPDGEELFAFDSGREDRVDVERARPIIYRGETIGRAEIGLSARPYRKELQRLLSLTALLFLGAVAVIFVAAGMLLRVMLRRPLEDLRRGMEQIERGSAARTPDRPPYQELAGIIERFQKMGRRVRDRGQALTDANRRLRAEVAERRRAETVNRVLLDIANAVVTAHDLDELYGTIHRTLGRIIDLSNFFIALYDHERRAIVFPYWRDEVDADFPEVADFSETGSLTGEVIMARRPLMLRREALQKRAREGRLRGTPPVVWLGAPLMVGHRVVGVMAAQSYADSERYTEADLELLSSVSGQVAMVIERKRSEAALRESEARFKTLFDVSPQVISVSELETGRFVDVNAEFCRLSGYDKDQAVGRTAVELGLFTDEERRAVVDALNAGGGEILGLERNFPKKSGEVAETLLSARKIRIEEREMILAVVNDITPLRQALREREELQERLARSQKMEALGLLAGGVAHDLNNILSGLVSYPDLLLAGLEPDSPMRRPVETIKTAGQRAAAVVADLLTLARGVVRERETVGLGRLVTEYLESPEFAELARRHPGVSVKTELDESDPWIHCSPVHVKKVVMNLVANAAEALGEAGGRVTLRVNRRRVSRAFRGQAALFRAQCAVLTVADTGPGIAEGELDRVFEPFYTRKTLGRSGTGLGLTVVWNTVQDHDGRIDVCSGAGGTAFEVFFPLAGGEEKAAACPLPEIPVTGNGQRILVVDDEETQREIACEMLNRLGYQAWAVSSGEAALAWLQTRSADLVLLDMLMPPGMNGRATYEAIAARRPRQRAIIASGFSQDVEVRQAQRLGAGGYLKKPYTLEEMARAVRAELSREGGPESPSSPVAATAERGGDEDHEN
ncbi:MAG: response regulator [Desulfococcaceae bacterium]